LTPRSYFKNKICFNQRCRCEIFRTYSSICLTVNESSSRVFLHAVVIVWHQGSGMFWSIFCICNSSSYAFIFIFYLSLSLSLFLSLSLSLSSPLLLFLSFLHFFLSFSVFVLSFLLLLFLCSWIQDYQGQRCAWPINRQSNFPLP
jgi:hypothetical protein